jgi:hypothetical protein
MLKIFLFFYSVIEHTNTTKKTDRRLYMTIIGRKFCYDEEIIARLIFIFYKKKENWIKKDRFI